ncbi:MAG: helix-turn-helix domain-containing protein [Holosporales bacterium]|jgi:transcriptional regulator with XRE-family HTH domain|nr:helix-turn-helix domain-containing protein [Holosporales bacterium]
MRKETSKPFEKRGGQQTARPSSIDQHVGMRVRTRRSVLRLSQGQLGEAVGLTFQQVQKYERGVNRISASRLLEISRALEVDISYFFEGLDKTAKPKSHAAVFLEENGEAYAADPLDRRETYDLIRAYYGVGDTRVRSHFLEFIKAIGESRKKKAHNEAA